MDRRVIVGDGYAEFSKHPQVQTASQFLEQLRASPRSWAGARLCVGQGLSPTQLEELTREATSHNLLLELPTSEVRAPVSLTHKSNADYVLVTRPLRVAPCAYRGSILIDAQVDRLSDHVTGEHIGGMLLIEAARQFGIAAVEIEYDRTEDNRWGLMWSGLRVAFTNYAFPLPTEVLMHIHEDESKRRPNQVVVSVTLELTQAGQVIAEVGMDATLLNRPLLRKIEAKRSAQVIEGFLRARGEDSSSVGPAETASASAEVVSAPV